MNRENRHEFITATDDFVSNAVAAHQAALLRYATRLLGDDAHRARDVVQDTFVRLLAASRAEVETHVAEWLFMVCRHRAFDVLRKEGRMSRLDDMAGVAGAGSGSGADVLIAHEPRPGRALEAAETREALLGLIERLPANQQEVIRLKFQTGFSYKEISRITEHSVSNVGFLIHTAVQRLRAEFAAQKP